MTEQELQEIYELLKKSRLNPQWCDTCVPYYENGVKAGVPSDPGDIVKDDYLMLPRGLVGWKPIFVINVMGDSMREAGIMSGDRLQVQIDATVSDGDIVVAEIDGECTVKTFCTDEYGQKWLVPRNDDYEPILLTEDMNVRIVGKVVEHIRDAPRTPYSDCLKVIRRKRGGKGKEAEALSQQRIEKAVKVVAQQVEHGRQWYAVYRAMLDRGATEKDGYSGFVELVTRLVPEHGHLPVAGELRRMAVQSFRKQVALWERKDAPVSGQRYDDYLRIARVTLEALDR